MKGVAARMKKRLIALITVLALSACLGLPVGAAAPQKVKSLHPQFAEKLYSASVSGEGIRISSLQNLNVKPGSELDIVLSGSDGDADLFLDQNGEPIKTADVTASKMRATGVTTEVYDESGTDLIESVGIVVQNSGTSAAKPVLRVCFTPDFYGLEPQVFSVTVYISIGGVKQEQSGIKIAGALGNPVIYAKASDIAVYADGSVVAALEDVPYIELQAGYGVTVAASLRQGGRYRVQACRSEDTADIAAMERNNAMIDIIELYAAGFDGEEITGVRIETAESLSVYDENGELLGETVRAAGIGSYTKDLPFRQKYYLVWRDKPLNISEALKPAL